MAHDSLVCMVNPEIGHRLETLDRRIGAPRTAVVVGAGPAGLEAARRLALRGFETTLIDAADAIGGQLRFWSDTPSRREFQKIIGWWGDELDRLDVALRLGTEATVEGLRAERPSVVLLATGSAPVRSPVPARGGTLSFGPYDAPPSGGHVLVYDEVGRLSSMLTAERLSLGWRKVSFVTSMLHPGEGEGLTTAYSLLRALGQRGIAVVDRAKLARLEAGTAHLEGVFGEARPPIEGVDAVVSLTGAVSVDPLLAPLRAARVDARAIGDAKLPRGVTEAVRDAFMAVQSLEGGRNASADGPEPIGAAA